MPKAELIDIAAEVRGETDKAYRLHDGTKMEWVPKSQVEANGDGTFTMPLWLAKAVLCGIMAQTPLNRANHLI